MTETLKVIDDVTTDIFLILYFVLFYLSLKKFFLTEKKSKVKLFLITVFTYPLFTFSTAWAICYYLLGWEKVRAAGQISGISPVKMIIFSMTVSGTFFLFILLCTFFVGRWFRLKSKAPLLFLFLMFNTFFVFQFRGDSRLAAIDANAYYGFDIVSNVVSLLLLWDFYRLDVREFANLPIDEMEIDWKVFLFPPTLFLILYATFALAFEGIKNTAVIYTGSVFSVAIGILFIWAFYVIIKNMQATHDVKTLSVEVMEALAHTIDAKDEYTKGHSVRVAKYSRMLAEKLGLSPKDCESVYYMALLHDIGKIGVPNSIINSKTRLTDEEFAVIKKHPGLGYDILSEIKSRPDLSTGARWHHERFDGKGYPDKKSGEEIPYFARIIAVADSYDAMTSNRSYRGYLSQEAVRLEIEKNSGTQFDRDVARCMLDVIDEDKEYKLHE